MIEIKGDGEIVARVICDSISTENNRLTTFEVEVPRIVWCELLTHSMLCRNAASSRAIPFSKMKEQLKGKPVRFGKAKPGMQDGGRHTELINGLYSADEWWNLAKLSAEKFTEGFYEAGFAKQIYNRLIEPFQMIKGVVSATEWENFFWLRNHDAVDPTLQELARCMFEAREKSIPQFLKPGEYHLPYVLTTREDNEYMRQEFWADNCDGKILTTEEAIKVSIARCAAVSFRNTDYDLKKSLVVYDRLISDDRKHASAFQHQATPMQPYTCHTSDAWEATNDPKYPDNWQPGISHADRDGKLWSAQYKGWIMQRKLIPGENYTGENK